MPKFYGCRATHPKFYESKANPQNKMHLFSQNKRIKLKFFFTKTSCITGFSNKCKVFPGQKYGLEKYINTTRKRIKVD